MNRSGDWLTVRVGDNREVLPTLPDAERPLRRHLAAILGVRDYGHGRRGWVATSGWCAPSVTARPRRAESAARDEAAGAAQDGHESARPSSALPVAMRST